MTSKFDTLFESNFSRFQGGGFLTGDIIKLKDGWESDAWATNAPVQVVEKLRELAGSDLVLRVSSVKALRPAVNSSVDQSLGVDDFHVDITQESAPGRFTGVFVTVPQHIIELNGANDTLPDIPDSLKREEDVDLKPKELKNEGEGDDFTNPGSQTGMNDKTNRNMTDTNTTLPGATAAASYTAKYIS
jgi:predicted outer membrane repeat protein